MFYKKLVFQMQSLTLYHIQAYIFYIMWTILKRRSKNTMFLWNYLLQYQCRVRLLHKMLEDISDKNKKLKSTITKDILHNRKNDLEETDFNRYQ